MIRMRMADSGALVGQWQALRNWVFGVVIAAKARKMMGAYWSGGLWIWSLADDRRPGVVQSNSAATADALPPRATDDEALSISNQHSDCVSSVAFSGDGQMAASCAYYDRFVLVWDTATGTVLRKLDIPNESGRTTPWRVAVSNSGYWILCVSIVEGDDNYAYLYLWGRPSNQAFSTRFKCRTEVRDCCATIHASSHERPHGAILREDYFDGYKTYAWACSGSSDPEIIVTPTAPSEDVVSECKQARQGSRGQLLLDVMNATELHVRKAALDRVARCTCKAAAVFDCSITCKSAWSDETTTARPGDRASTSSPKVAVGLQDGTVHFMELCSV
jgi:WD40 repeat protein